MNRPDVHDRHRALAKALRERDAERFASEIRRAADLGAAERRKLVATALEVAAEKADHDLLIAVLAFDDPPQLRADALSVVLSIADESSPRFSDLIDALREGERWLVLGALIESSRLDPDQERRLLRLKRLVRLAPRHSRGMYWSEAERLAERSGDDAQLTLLGFVRELPPPIRPLTVATLKRAARKVENAFKRSMAFLALSELVDLDRDDLRDARSSAAGIPDETLRTVTLARLSRLDDTAAG